MPLRTGDIATSRVQDAVDARNLPLEGVHKAGGIPSHGADEDPGPVPGRLLRVDDPPRALDAQAEWLLDHDVLARLERRDAVRGMVFVRCQDDDEVDARVIDDLVRVRAAPGDVEWDWQNSTAVRDESQMAAVSKYWFSSCSVGR